MWGGMRRRCHNMVSLTQFVGTDDSFQNFTDLHGFSGSRVVAGHREGGISEGAERGERRDRAEAAWQRAPRPPPPPGHRPALRRRPRPPKAARRGRSSRGSLRRRAASPTSCRDRQRCRRSACPSPPRHRRSPSPGPSRSPDPQLAPRCAAASHACAADTGYRKALALTRWATEALALALALTRCRRSACA